MEVSEVDNYELVMTTVDTTGNETKLVVSVAIVAE